MNPRRISLLATAAVVVAVALGARAVLTRRRDEAWRRIERVCACGDTTRRQLTVLERVSVGGLELVSRLQRRALEDDCDDLRVAQVRQRPLDVLAGRPLSVSVSPHHRGVMREMVVALERMCELERPGWDSLRARVTSPAPAGEDPRVREAAREQLRIRDAMCARRPALLRPPQDYTLTRAELAQQAVTCGETRGR